MWQVLEEGFNKEHITNNGNKFMTGNGYMGYRGTLEEYRAKELVACNLANLYDQQGKSWREPINAPNGLYTTLLLDGEELSLLNREPSAHAQALELREGLHRRSTVWDTAHGKVRIKAERFVSLAEVHLICLKYAVTVEQSCEITIKTGIDTAVWDINGPHLEAWEQGSQGAAIYASAVTQELKVPVIVSEVCWRSFEAEEELEKNNQGIYRLLKIKAEPQTTYTICKYVTVYTGNDAVANVAQASISAALSAAAKGYEVLLEEHKKQWAIRWKASDIRIDGSDEDQLALRYSIYHLQIIAPAHAQGQSIPARGLSGQTYKGAIFWDTEMFMLPFFLHTAPEVARNLISYRIKTLEGARRKAAYYGFRGAYYAWESQETGDDACSDYNVTDVFTGRPVRTYFKDKQIHISAAVAYAIWEVYKFTGDVSILLEGGAETILECARFYHSYAYYKEDKERYELLDVIGPDEYHERVNNNAYTSKMAEHTIEIALEALALLKEKAPQQYEDLLQKLDYHTEIQNLKSLKKKLYVPAPNEHTGVIEQFDGYHRLEDCTLAEVKSRVLNPKEYWGGGHGVASDTKIIKQADVVLMLYLFRNEYTHEVKQANWTYYEPRTEHGSSLSPCIYSLLSCDIGNVDWAYPFFVKSANIDLTGISKQFAGSIYIGGTHPAANGGAWMAAVLGFAGLQVQDGEIKVNPRLPKPWKSMSFHINVRGEWYAVEITGEQYQIRKIGLEL